MRKILLALAVLALFVGTADAQTATPVIGATPQMIAPPGFRVLSRGKCVVNPASIGDGAEQIVSCAAPGAMVGSLVIAAIETTSDLTDTYIKRAGVTENGRVDISLGAYTTGTDAGVLTINFAVVQ